MVVLAARHSQALTLFAITQTQAAWYAYLAVAGIGRNVGAPLMRISEKADRHRQRTGACSH